MNNWFGIFLFQDSVHSELIHGSYNPWLVALSFAVAICAAMLALQLGRLSSEQTSSMGKRFAVITGCVTLGAGIWAMHFIGMLAHNLHAEVNYDPVITSLSMFPGLFASYIVLRLISAQHLTYTKLIAGGVAVGAGIGAMHYAGMLAMRMDLIMRFDPFWVAVSVVVAIVLATLALWIGIFLNKQGKLPRTLSTVLGGIMMGSAITAMHYTGMTSACFIGNPDPFYDLTSDNSTSLSLGIALVTILTGVLAVSMNALARYKRMLSTLKVSETRLSTILDTAVDGIITINIRGEVLSFNSAAEKLFGWTPSDVIGRNISMLMPEPYRSGHDGYLHNYLTTGQAKIIGVGRDMNAQRKDGSIFPIRLAIGEASLPNEVVFVGFVTDLTDRQFMEKTVREKDHQLRLMMNNIPGVAFRCRYDNHWSMLLISDAVAQLTGWSAEDFMQGRTHFMALANAEDVPRITAAIESATRADSSYRVEYRIKDKASVEKWVSEFGSVIYNDHDEPVMLDGVILDITEAKHRNADFEGVVNAINNSTSVAEFTKEGITLTANDNFLKLLGYTLDEIKGKHHAIFSSAEDAASDRYKNKWEALRRGEFVQGEFLRFGKNGQQVWINAAYSPVLDANGLVSKVMMFMIDISERKRMEQDLREAKEHAEEAVNVKATFLANMSHEIRTPMNAIIGFSDLMMDTSMQEDQRSYVSTISHSARSLLHLLNDILDSAKLDKGMLDLEEIDFSMNNLVDSTISTLWLQARRKNLELKLDISPEVSGYYFGAEHRIRQVLMNLLGNAIKFTDTGYVQLHVYQTDTQAVRFDVTDTGIGIPADRLDLIFEPFTQADASMSRRFGGTGLGTTISKQLVELMGGTLTATSTIGQGSCFSVVLPLRTGSQVATVITENTHTLPPLRILVADDIRQNRDLLNIVLSRNDHTITLASNGEEAVALFEQHPFDMILMDVQMPTLDGLSASRQIRELERQRGATATPIIALTASVLKEDRIAAQNAGMNGFVSKPVDLEQLTLEMLRVLQPQTTAHVRSAPATSSALKDIHMTRGVALWGSQSLYLHELAQFIAEHQQQIDAIATAINTGNLSQLKSIAHANKGTSANLTLPKLNKAYADLDTNASATPETLSALLTSLQQAWAALQNAAEKILRHSDAPSQPLADDGVNEAQFVALLHLLRATTLQATLDETLLAQLQSQTPMHRKSDIRKIASALNDFEFDHALQGIDCLLADYAPGVSS